MNLIRRFFAFFRRSQLDREMAEEMQSHLDMETAHNRAAGMSSDEARYAARRAFGGIDQIKERERDERDWAWLEQPVKNLRFAARSLIRTPGFTASAVLTLALGIGGTTAVFSIVNQLFFRPLPVRDPEGLVLVVNQTSISSLLRGIEYPNYLDLRAKVDAFSGLIAYSTQPVHLHAAGAEADRIFIATVSGNYFSFFGADAAQGRLFLPGEGERIGADPIVVLGYRYWQQHFGSDVAVLGRSVELNGQAFTVIGIAPAAFAGAPAAMAADAFVPATMLGRIWPQSAAYLERRAGMPFNIMGRLKPGVSPGQALVAVNTVMTQIAKDYPEQNVPGRFKVIRETHARPDPSFTEFMPIAIAVFMGLVGLVLLIACANVANLMFSRALVRRREMAIRAALGASRLQLCGQLLAESLLLAILAGGVGLQFGFWGANAFARLASSATPIPLFAASWDWRLFAFTAGVALLAGFLTGLFPALKASRVDLLPALKEGGALLASSRHPFRSFLVVTQVAVSLIVLICGGVFLQSLGHVSPALLGFRSDHLLLASMDLGMQRYDAAHARRFETALTEKAGSMPGVEAATLGSFVPFSWYSNMTAVAPEGKEVRSIQDTTITSFSLVAPDFRSVIGIDLARGRDFTLQDTLSTPKVVIINEELAGRLWPGADAVGKRLVNYGNGTPEQLEVVGIVRNGRYNMVGEAPSPFLLRPLAQTADVPPVTLFVRTRGEPEALAADLRKLVHTLDPGLPLYGVETMEHHLDNGLLALLPLRAGAALAAVQGTLALLLVVIGLYGVISFVVSQRTREIGIRIALGARRSNVLRLVIGNGIRLTLFGIAIGGVLSLGLMSVLRGVLHDLAPGAAPVFAATILLLVAVAWLACWLPARRAAGINPARTLRAE